MLKWEDYIAAARELSPSGLNLYMYLAKNKDGYEFHFSSKDYCDTFGVVDKTYRNARNELLKKGYLKEGENNHVYFDSKAGYRDTKEGLKKTLLELCNRINCKDESRGEKIKIEMAKADLKNITDEKLYIIEIKKIISFAEDMLKEISEDDYKSLL